MGSCSLLLPPGISGGSKITAEEYAWLIGDLLRRTIGGQCGTWLLCNGCTSLTKIGQISTSSEGLFTHELQTSPGTAMVTGKEL
jgi:hypothetical protein